ARCLTAASTCSESPNRPNAPRARADAARAAKPDMAKQVNQRAAAEGRQGSKPGPAARTPARRGKSKPGPAAPPPDAAARMAWAARTAWAARKVARTRVERPRAA